MSNTPARYADAERMGIALGLVLLLSFVIAGRGIGASGAFAVVVGSAAARVVPSSHAGWRNVLPDGVPGSEWIVWEVIGIAVGAAFSAWRAGRFGASDAPASGHVVARSLAGGALMGLGARLAYGCTSGLALSGGALMATGAFVFIGAAFGTAILVTRLSKMDASDRSEG